MKNFKQFLLCENCFRKGYQIYHNKLKPLSKKYLQDYERQLKYYGYCLHKNAYFAICEICLQKFITILSGKKENIIMYFTAETPARVFCEHIMKNEARNDN